MTWERIANQLLKDEEDFLVQVYWGDTRKDFLSRDYIDERNQIHSLFSVNCIHPFAYATRPMIIDYRLYADLIREHQRTGDIEKFENIDLGETFRDSYRRKRINFAENFWQESREFLSWVACESFIRRQTILGNVRLPPKKRGRPKNEQIENAVLRLYEGREIIQIPPHKL